MADVPVYQTKAGRLFHLDLRCTAVHDWKPFVVRPQVVPETVPKRLRCRRCFNDFQLSALRRRARKAALLASLAARAASQ